MFGSKKRKAPPEKPVKLDPALVHRLAMELEKAKLGDYVQMMSKPWRSIWLNFIAGVSRGVGMVVGASVVGGLVVVLTMQGLRTAFEHAGGVPWIGDKVKAGVAFILQVANEQLGEAPARGPAPARPAPAPAGPASPTAPQEAP
jgi:hypothetical protein